MGKKSQARPGLDGMGVGSPNLRQQAMARRKAERASKKKRKQLTPGGKVGKKKPVSALEQLKRERQAELPKRQQRAAELEKKGVLYDPNKDKAAAPTHPCPSYRQNVSVKKMVLFTEITLHNIPLEKITCNPSEDRLRVDTLLHSKKWVLDIAHPKGIKVDPNGEAELTPSGVLSVKLKITHLPKEVEEEDAKKQESIAAVKHLRFRRNQAGEVVVGKKKTVESRAAAAQEKRGKKKKRAEDGGEEKEAEEGQQQKKKKPKTFVTDKGAALSLIESIEQDEEPKKQHRKTMLDHAQDMKAERKERRVEKRAKKKTMEEQAMKQIAKTKASKAKRDLQKAVSSVTPLKEPTGRRVSFA